MGFGGSGNSGPVSIGTSTDVVLNSPQNSQVLTYDSGIGKWKNANSTGGESLTASKNTATSGAVTLTAGTSSTLTKFSATLTANRTITLSGTTANSYFDISFLETVFGTYTITITDGSFSHVFSYPTYVKYVYIGSVWERVL
ncbi:MAG: hypothetical protein WBP26_03930 [Candidatus Saccharimonadales bacterium]